MLRWSIATVCLGGGLEVKFSAAAKAGFRAIELLDNDLTFYAGTARDARALADDLGLDIVALQPLRDFEGAPGPQRQRNFDRAKRKLELTRELGAPLLCLSSSISEGSSPDVGRIAGDLAELADLARQFGLRLGYEALSWGRHIKDWTAAWEVVAKADRDNLGIVLDCFHICARKNPIEPIAALPGDKIALVEVADLPALAMDLKSLSRHYRCYPGQGDYPVANFLDAVLRSGYRGPMSLETYSEQFRGASAARSRSTECVRCMATGEALRALRVAKEEPPIAEIAALPPTPGRQGAAFLEFAVSDKAGAGTRGAARRAWIRTSSAATARRRSSFMSKATSTSSSTGSATHSPIRSSCSTAPRSAQWRSRSTVSSARSSAPARWPMHEPHRAYGSRRSDGPRHRRGRRQPHLFRRSAQARTGATISSAKRTAGPKGPLKAIDHLSNVVRRNEFLSWLLFYETVLGLKAEPQIEVYDPHGDFYSRSLRTRERRAAHRAQRRRRRGDGRLAVSRRIWRRRLPADRAFRPTTSSPPSKRRDGRASSSCRFRTIITTIWRRRFEIAPDLLQRMREFGVLYDRVETGSSSTSTRALSTIVSFSKFSSETTTICSARPTRRCGWRRRRRSTTRKRA